MRLAAAILVMAGPTALAGEAGNVQNPGEELVIARVVATRPDAKGQRALTITPE
jgi:hypothetical protein